ncbi:MAG: hypothetical protein HY908_08955 [Myxococcales bacterium]|nr:hypothetical protein [Myxococcales bacterium]
MEQIKNLLVSLGRHFEALANANAVVARPISMGNRHVLPLCELSLAFGAGGGAGEVVAGDSKEPQKGVGGGAAGGSKASPIAVVVIVDGKVRLEKIGD